jgi:hypothetical protein
LVVHTFPNDPNVQVGVQAMLPEIRVARFRLGRLWVSRASLEYPELSDPCSGTFTSRQNECPPLARTAPYRAVPPATSQSARVVFVVDEGDGTQWRGPMKRFLTRTTWSGVRKEEQSSPAGRSSPRSMDFCFRPVVVALELREKQRLQVSRDRSGAGDLYDVSGGAHFRAV